MSQLILRNCIRYSGNEYATKAVCNSARSLKDLCLPGIAHVSRQNLAFFRCLTSSVCSWPFDQHYSDVLQSNRLNYKSCQYFTRSMSSKRDHSKSVKPNPSAGTEKLVDLRGKRCPGCGASFQSHSEDKFGYTLERKLIDVPISQVDSLICQRCFCLHHYKKALNITMSEEDWRLHMQKIPKEGAIAVLVVDVFDFPNSLFPNLLEVIGETIPIIVLANKTDLLIEDGPQLTERIRDMVWQGCKDAGLAEGNLVDICLVSAKKSQGIKESVDKILQHRPPHGDIFLLGSANVGKSSLFKCFLDFLYNGKPKDLIQYPTTSVWPGTTIGLLRYPLRKKTFTDDKKWRKQLKGIQNKYIYELPSLDEDKSVKKPITGSNSNATSDDNVMVAFEDEVISDWNSGVDESGPFFYDTPGAINNNMTINFLNIRDLSKCLPLSGLSPRTLVLKPSQTAFLGGLGRVDFIEGKNPSYFTFYASLEIPLHICQTSNADEIYKKHFGQPLLKVPNNMNNQYKAFPKFKPKDYSFICDNGWRYSSADIVFSSAGFATITGARNDGIKIRAYTPGGRGLVLRRPSLMPYAVNWRGKMKRNIYGHFRGKIARQKVKKQFQYLQPYQPRSYDTE